MQVKVLGKFHNTRKPTNPGSCKTHTHKQGKGFLWVTSAKIVFP